MIELGAEHREQWAKHRYVHLPGALGRSEVDALRSAADELHGWAERPGRWMKYFEPGPERRLCRIENFLPFHAGLRELLLRDDVTRCVGELLGEPGVLFKEKLNFKLPGGDGFAPHQDAPAFVAFGQTYHVTLMVSIDATTPANGCLEIVDGHSSEETLPQRDDATLDGAVVEQLEWHALPTQPGDFVLFDSYVPHRSGPNRSDAARRALYVTYNRASEGDRRDEYFALKRVAFPPECERDPAAPPHPARAMFNVGNPIR